MFCQKCGTQLPDGSVFCSNCGSSQDAANTANVAVQAAPIQGTFAQPQRHDVPMCTCCGYIGPWKEEPLILGRHWLIAGLTLILGGFGIFYLITVMIIRSGKGRRAKICQHCGARNLFNFFY